MTNRDQKLPGGQNHLKGISSFVSQEDDEIFSFAAYADRFDEHINRSIRGYSQLRDDTVAISRYFVENETMVLDVGCSQGTLLKRIKAANTQAPKACYVGIDIEPSFEKYWHAEEGLSYECADIRNWTGSMPLSLAVSLFTLQFIPERERFAPISQIYSHLMEGGALIVSEKVYCEDSRLQNILESLHRDHKRQFFSDQHILDKEKELRHLAKFSTEEQLQIQLRKIGFRYIQVFWRNFNFVGIIAIK